MRAALLLAIFGTLAVIAAWFIASAIVRKRNGEKRIAELEKENEQLDELIRRQAKKRTNGH